MLFFLHDIIFSVLIIFWLRQRAAILRTPKLSTIITLGFFLDISPTCHIPGYITYLPTVLTVFVISQTQQKTPPYNLTLFTF